MSVSANLPIKALIALVSGAILLMGGSVSAKMGLVNVNEDKQAYQEFINKAYVQDLIAEIERTRIEGATFKYNPNGRIVIRAKELPRGLDPENFVKQEQVIMFLSSDWYWLCEARIYSVWENTEPKSIVEEFTEYNKPSCYRRL